MAKSFGHTPNYLNTPHHPEPEQETGYYRVRIHMTPGGIVTTAANDRPRQDHDGIWRADWIEVAGYGSVVEYVNWGYVIAVTSEYVPAQPRR